MGVFDNIVSMAKNQIAASKDQAAHRALCEKDASLSLVILHGYKEMGLPQNVVIRQRVDGSTYFGYEDDRLYKIVGYEWNGPMYNKVTASNTVSNSQTNTVKKGKSGKMATGAIVGTLLMPGVGTVVGAAIGAGGKSKSQSNTNGSSDTKQISSQQEVNTPAILRLCDADGNIFSLNFSCNAGTDAKIRCFRIEAQKSVSAASKDATDTLKGIKALKELLDMGAITQEEYDAKKKEMLNF